MKKVVRGTRKARRQTGHEVQTWAALFKKTQAGSPSVSLAQDSEVF
jgi:hypothetical protein